LDGGNSTKAAGLAVVTELKPNFGHSAECFFARLLAK